MRELLPHEQRVVQEKEELQAKIGKLGTFLAGTTEVSELDRKMLSVQLCIMNSYLNILNLRIQSFTGEVPTSLGENTIRFFGTEKPDVMYLKVAAMQFIDTINAVVTADPRRKAIAITKIEEAQMMAVEGLFNEPK